MNLMVQGKLLPRKIIIVMHNQNYDKEQEKQLQTLSLHVHQYPEESQISSEIGNEFKMPSNFQPVLPKQLQSDLFQKQQYQQLLKFCNILQITQPSTSNRQSQSYRQEYREKHFKETVKKLPAKLKETVKSTTQKQSPFVSNSINVMLRNMKFSDDSAGDEPLSELSSSSDDSL